MSEQKSLVDEIREDPKEAAGLAAAELAMNTAILLHDALESRPDLSIADIAELAGVSEERVRCVFSLNDPDDKPEGVSWAEWSSDGNLHTASIGRFLNILGYELKLSVKAIDEKADDDFVNNNRERRRQARLQKRKALKESKARKG